MNSLWALALLCLSPVETFGNITVVNRLPAGCTQVLGSPPLPTSLPDAVAPPIQEMTYTETAQPVVKKKAQKKKASTKRAKCKPGRTRNSKGICGRWR